MGKDFAPFPSTEKRTENLFTKRQLLGHIHFCENVFFNLAGILQTELCSKEFGVRWYITKTDM